MKDNYSLCMTYLEKMPPAIANSGGDKATRRAAMVCRRFNLSESETWQAMGWYNDNRCQPKWSEKDLRHKMSGLEGVTVTKPLGQSRQSISARTFTPPVRPVKPADTRPIIQRSAQEEETWFAQWCIEHGTTLEAFDRKVGNV